MMKLVDGVAHLVMVGPSHRIIYPCRAGLLIPSRIGRWPTDGVHTISISVGSILYLYRDKCQVHGIENPSKRYCVLWTKGLLFDLILCRCHQAVKYCCSLYERNWVHGMR